MLLQEFIYVILIAAPSSLVSTRDLHGAHLTLTIIHVSNKRKTCLLLLLRLLFIGYIFLNLSHILCLF